MSVPQLNFQPKNNFEVRLNAMNVCCERVIERSNKFLSKLDHPKKTSIFMLVRLINLNKNELEILEKEKNNGFYGELSKHRKLTEAKESLEQNLAKLEETKKNLEDQGYKNIAQYVIDDLPATNDSSDNILQKIMA